VKLEIDHLSLPCSGELENGDAVVTRIEDDGALIAVVDALGHGPPAAKVAASVVECLSQVALGENAASVMGRLDTRLRGTRGAAVLLCVFHASRLEACSVGNVEIRSVGTPLPLVSTPGIVGNGWRRLKVYAGPIPNRERFIVHTDGVSSRFDPAAFGPPGRAKTSRVEVCATLMRRLRRQHDDATILVADLESAS
jgi:phosphoserine phosphatase RsbX